MELLDKISYLREQKGWSLYQLAQKSGLSYKTIYKWYNKESVPTIKALEAISEALQVPFYSLFTSYDTIIADEETMDILNKWQHLTTEHKKIVKDIINSYLKWAWAN